MEDQPDPEAECKYCIEKALREGRSVGIDPNTNQVLHIRALQKVGYRFEPNDLQYWQWEALVAVDQAIEKYKADKLKGGKET